MQTYTPYAEQLSLLPIIKIVAEKQQQVAALRPLSADLEGRVLQKLRLDWNYHSNAIEGNPMSYGETVTYLMYGLTAKGKTLKDHLDIKGHNEALQFLLAMAKEARDFSEVDIRALHRMILVEPYYSAAMTAEGLPTKKLIALGEYKTMPNSVRTPTGEMHYYASAEDTPILMRELMDWYHSAKNNPNIHAVVLAAMFHHRFVAIHPFDDGNGRLGRILMNLILMRQQLPPAIIQFKARESYIYALNMADSGNYEPLVTAIAESLIVSLDLYVRAAKGEPIEEIGDVDKELNLFVRSFGDDKMALIEKSDAVVYSVLENSIFPLFETLMRKLEVLKPLFSGQSLGISLQIQGRLMKLNSYTLADVWEKYHSYSGGDIDKLHLITFRYTLENFNRTKDTFDVSVEYYVYFQKMRYIFEQQYLSKRLTYTYSETIDQIERLALVEEIVKKVMQEIKTKSANS
jgi:Fic family protein